MLDTISMAKQLHGEYKAAFEWADVYSTSHDLTLEELDEKMMELYDLLLEAQNEEKEIEKIVGTDLELFCKNFFEKEGGNRLKELLNRLFGISVSVLVYSLIDLFVFAEEQSDLTPIFVGGVAGMIVDALAKYALGPYVLKKKIKPIIYYFIVIGVFLATIIAFIICLDDFQFEIGSWILLVLSGLYAAVFWTARAIRRYKDHGTIFSKDRETKKALKKFNQEVSDANLILPSAEGLAVRFKRYRKRKQRKGLEYTFEEYAAKIRKEESQVNWISMIVAVIQIIVVIGGGISVGDTLSDALIFMAIQAVMQFFIWRWISKANAKMMKMQVGIIEECEGKGIDIVEYVDEIKGMKNFS